MNETIINKDIKDFDSYILGLDLGGTNTNLLFSGVKDNKPIFLSKYNFETYKICSIIDPINQVLDYIKDTYNILIKNASIGVPGVISKDNNYAELTNISWNVSKDEILNKTNLEKIVILNDFECIGYGINILKESDLDLVKSGNIIKNQTKAIVGAGSGLGKSILRYDKNLKIYIPIKSEGGHGDIPVYDIFELELINFIKEELGIKEQVTYEEILSGKGILNIYNYISKKYEKTSNYENIISSENKAEKISELKNIDKNCKKTFDLFSKFYARCLKNLALDSLSQGGIYIAGGIAIKNKEIFETNEFISEFESAYKKTTVLKNIPIFLIKNYDVSIYGAILAGIHLIK